MAVASDATLKAVESWFVSRGVPHFVADHSATRVVLRRTAPLLVLYLVVSVLLTASFQWSFEANVLAVAAAAALVFGAWALVNVVRGRKWSSLPDRVGAVEIAAFLIIPTLPPLLIGLQVSDAMVAFVESALFLAVVYVATSYGLVGSVTWAFGRAKAQVGNLGHLLTRALPLLMVFIAFTFLSNSVWEVAAALSWQAVVTVVAFFFGLSLTFLIARLVPEIRRLVAVDETWEETLSAVADTPAAPLVAQMADTQPPEVPMEWHEWLNVLTLVVFGQGIQIALVTLAVQLALVVFGLLLVPVPI